MPLPSGLTENAAAPVDDAVRNRLAQRLAAAEGDAVTWFPQSLTRAGDAWFIAFEDNGAPKLLQYGGGIGAFGLANATERRFNGDAVYVYPFAATDRGNVAAFAERIDPAFLPRPQRNLRLQ